MNGSAGPEEDRLNQDAQRQANWKRWGPYLSERQWGTVREDYSADGDCWDCLTHDAARSRAYRWGEDGILGITDRECRVCFAMTLWNGRDPILKERLFGLSGPEGNHGEDVKEQYFYIDSTPTHSYMKGLYKYPQAEFPYEKLLSENRRRGKSDPEYEIVDTGVFDQGRYFDVVVEYAKATSDDILIRITATNRGPDPAVLHLLPTVWFRNSWAWGCTHEGCEPKGTLSKTGPGSIAIDHATLGKYRFDAELAVDRPVLLFTDNETNRARLFGVPNDAPFVKDGFHNYLIQGQTSAVNPAATGTKAAAAYTRTLAGGESWTIRMRLRADGPAAGAGATPSPTAPFDAAFDQTFALRIDEAEQFYARRISKKLSPAQRQVARQAYAGLLWNKQFYHYVVRDWLDGDPNQPPPPPQRRFGRNRDWRHVFNRDVISMPDTWEYPWFAAWDLAFHAVCFARIDAQFAKDQLLLLLREWYMHPSGKLPAYEFEFNDVNPPVHAWACWRVYKMTAPRGQRDRVFLERCFQKLLINFTWWVNRKDVNGLNIFGGGFLGLDNIGVFDRNKPLPGGGVLDQADGTAWMASYCLTMLAIALELAQHNPAYEDIASKFFEHFVSISEAMNTLGGNGLWDENDGFYYDQMLVNGATISLKLRSLVGLLPLIAVEVLEQSTIDKLPGFKKRMEWFLTHRKDLSKQISYMSRQTIKPASTSVNAAAHDHYLLAIPSKDRLLRTLTHMLDETEFLSPYGIRSLSRQYRDHPFSLTIAGEDFSVKYCPAESDSGLFGGNSNWRGPVWFPANFLFVESLERYYHFYGDELKVECPTGSKRMLTLQQISHELAMRLCALFIPRTDGSRPCHGHDRRFADDPHWKDLVLFYEYFDGDNGRGVGASHQTGWTALVGRLLSGEGQRMETSGEGNTR
jgi:hypothetical protein